MEEKILFELETMNKLLSIIVAKEVSKLDCATSIEHASKKVLEWAKDKEEKELLRDNFPEVF